MQAYVPWYRPLHDAAGGDRAQQRLAAISIDKRNSNEGKWAVAALA
jgi:hypothetical protein